MNSSDFDRALAGLGNIRFVNGNLLIPAGYLLETTADSIVAFATGGQTNATKLTAQTNRISTVATAGDSVRLPAAAAGLQVVVINHGAKAMQVYGDGTDTINDVATASGVSQMQMSTTIYTCISAGSWYSEGLASGFFGGLPTVSSTDTITAFAGGGQASATLLGSVLNRVTVVATAADSVKLPVAAPGMQISVTNASAAALAVFPNTGDQINGAGTNIVYSLAAGKTAQFSSASTINWHAALGA